jgi:hypothetical protein
VPLVVVPGQGEDLGLVQIADQVQATVHVAIEGGVADADFAFVAGRQHEMAKVVGELHQDRAADARLDVFLRQRGRFDA